jgi:hypothetical protein
MHETGYFSISFVTGFESFSGQEYKLIDIIIIIICMSV